MIGKVVKRRAGGAIELIAYLYREGPAGKKGLCSAHLNPRMIASWDGDPAALDPPIAPAGWRDYTRLIKLLEQPVRAAGIPAHAKPVYHLVLAAAKDETTGHLRDPYLGDAQWRDIAEEFMHQLGLAPRGDPGGVRWIAIRHADDHVHVVATLARVDGRRASLSNDYYLTRRACNYIEDKYGLTRTAPGDRTGVKRPTRAEERKAQVGWSTGSATRSSGWVPPRATLRRRVRTAAAAAENLDDFVARLRADRVLVRLRMSERNPRQITGYAVALATDVNRKGDPIYFGGGKLASDLTLPKLQRRWNTGTYGAASTFGTTRSEPTGDGTDIRFDDVYRAQIWEQAIAAAARATRQILAGAFTDPAVGADTAWAAADFLAAAARVVEGRRGGPLTAAADEYERAAREQWGRLPQPRHASRELRSAARLLMAARTVDRRDTRQLLELLARLTSFTEAVAHLRDTQQRAAQAAAARRAAEQLRRCRVHYDPGQLWPAAATQARRTSHPPTTLRQRDGMSRATT